LGLHAPFQSGEQLREGVVDAAAPAGPAPPWWASVPYGSILVVHPLGSGEHLVRALGECGVAVEEDRQQWFWRGLGRDAGTAVEAFVRCATELAETDASDDEQLAGRFDGGDLLLFESGPAHSESTRQAAVRDDTIAADAFTLSFTRQFSFEDDEGQHLFMERMGLEIWVPLDATLAAQHRDTIWGFAGPPGSEAERAAHEPPIVETVNGALAWHEAIAATAAYRRALAGPIDHFIITQGQV
jgi:hypothetical protein